ncbi:MAG: lipopolysaccharide transport periplasmic protein LptA [Sulfurospirillum sp.]|nr:lipopolysaccharide transport periplasmic protein LptA [Sulfurospirillum sp.]
MKFLIFLFLCINLAIASNVQIVAQKFWADEKKLISVFSGDVIITKEQDKLVAQEVTIDFDTQKQPLKYTATGDAKIDMMMHEKKYFAKADKMIYDPLKDEYELIGNAFLHEIATDKKVYGDTILVNQKNGKYEVDSTGKKPVKFIFKIEEKK